MPVAKLRAVGGSTLVAIPPALLRELGLGPKAEVEIRVEDGQLVIVPLKRPRYTLDELMARCDLAKPIRMSREEQDWQTAPRVGREEI